MKAIRFHLTVLAFAVLLAARAACAEPEAISVAGSNISLPAPGGFFRYDGKNQTIDDIEQRLLPAENRLLATFGSEGDLADVLKGQLPKLIRHFSVQSERSLESVAVTRTYFSQLKPEVRAALSSQVEQYRNAIKEIESNAGSVGLELKIGEAIPLGVFDETNDSLCFSTLVKVQGSTIRDSYVSIMEACIVRVRDHVLFLYATSSYREKADIVWTRQSVQRWRDAVLAANTE